MMRLNRRTKHERKQIVVAVLLVEVVEEVEDVVVQEEEVEAVAGDFRM